MHYFKKLSEYPNKTMPVTDGVQGFNFYVENQLFLGQCVTGYF